MGEEAHEAPSVQARAAAFFSHSMPARAMAGKRKANRDFVIAIVALGMSVFSLGWQIATPFIDFRRDSELHVVSTVIYDGEERPRLNVTFRNTGQQVAVITQVTFEAKVWRFMTPECYPEKRIPIWWPDYMLHNPVTARGENIVVPPGEAATFSRTIDWDLGGQVNESDVVQVSARFSFDEKGRTIEARPVMFLAQPLPHAEPYPERGGCVPEDRLRDATERNIRFTGEILGAQAIRTSGLEWFLTRVEKHAEEIARGEIARGTQE